MVLSRIEEFELKRSSDERCGYVLYVNGDRDYALLLIRAFPSLTFSPVFELQKQTKYDWGICIRGIKDELDKIEENLAFFKRNYRIKDNLDETYVMDWHTTEGRTRTTLGELVYKAKPYHRPVNKSIVANTGKLADKVLNEITAHRTLSKVKEIFYVPKSGDSYNLGREIAAKLCGELQRDISNLVIRKEASVPQKDIEDPYDKVRNVLGTFEVQTKLPYETALIIDDIYDSGATINELAGVLRAAGATSVYGFCLTKTRT